MCRVNIINPNHLSIYSQAGLSYLVMPGEHAGMPKKAGRARRLPEHAKAIQNSQGGLQVHACHRRKTITFVQARAKLLKTHHNLRLAGNAVLHGK